MAQGLHLIEQWTPVHMHMYMCYLLPLYMVMHIKHSVHHYNWASVSEPHTCDFNATFSLYICIYIYIYIYVICYISICDRHCTSNIAINISIFHLGLIRGARAYCPDAARRGAVGPTHC